MVSFWGVSAMRIGSVALSVLALAALPSVAFAACAGASCEEPVVVRAQRGVTIGAPPPGYTLDPSDARPDLYLVNQGPVYDGPNVLVFAEPTYSESGFAFTAPYPYVHFYSVGRGHQAFRAWRPHRHYGAKALNYPPYVTFRYRRDDETRFSRQTTGGTLVPDRVALCRQSWERS